MFRKKDLPFCSVCGFRIGWNMTFRFHKDKGFFCYNCYNLYRKSFDNKMLKLLNKQGGWLNGVFK